MPKFAIFGGTFNPIHWGHLLIAEAAFDQFHLDRVIWVPTFCPSHKAPPIISFEHRLEMVSRAITDHPAFSVSAVASQQQGTSYATATLHALQVLKPDVCWYWIIGNDAFQRLPQWKGSQALAAQCIWLVAPRAITDGARKSRKENAGNDDSKEAAVSLQVTPHASFRWHQLQMPCVAISSSLIRQRCRDGHSVQYLVPEAIRCYIVEQGLYQMS